MKRRYEGSDVEIEIWKYASDICCGTLRSKGKYPEPLSLYLSLRDTKDERVQGALDELLEGIKHDGGA